MHCFPPGYDESKIRRLDKILAKRHRDAGQRLSGGHLISASKLLDQIEGAILKNRDSDHGLKGKLGKHLLDMAVDKESENTDLLDRMLESAWSDSPLGKHHFSTLFCRWIDFGQCY